MRKYDVIVFSAFLSAAIAAGVYFSKPPEDMADHVLRVEHARVDALKAQDWDRLRTLTDPEFKHQESNGTVRSIDGFVAAMRWCGKDGVTPGRAEDMPDGGGFSFATHDINWNTVKVEVLPGEEYAIVTGKYSNILRRCFKRDDGTTGVETPKAAKPASFVRVYKDGRIFYHRAMVDSAAPPEAMSVNFPPDKDK